MPPPCPPGYVETRDALHRVARYGLVPFRWRVGDETWIEPSTGGFGTPRLSDGSRARVDGVELVVEQAGERRAERLTTLAAALRLLGVEGVRELEMPDIPGIGNLDGTLPIDPVPAAFLADWFALGWDVLGELRSDPASADGGELHLWTHHFDPAFECLSEAEGRRATYGLSPGDLGVQEPYAYVAPWAFDRVRRGSSGTRRPSAARSCRGAGWRAVTRRSRSCAAPVICWHRSGGPDEIRPLRVSGS